jgi:hypothetical protein
MKAVQVLAILGGSYVASLVVAFVMIILTAGLTSSWGASRAGNAMMAMLGGVALVFLIASIVSFFLLRSSVPAIGWRIAILVGYAAIQVVTLAAIAFMSAVIFNR